MYYNEWSGGLQRPLQPIRIDEWGEARFLGNRIVGSLFSYLRRSGMSLNTFLGPVRYSDGDKIQLLQLLGYPVRTFLEIDWIDEQTRERVRDIWLDLVDGGAEPGDGSSEPVPLQPLDLDPQGRLVFVPNEIVASVETLVSSVRGMQQAVNGSAGQLAGGYSDEEWFQCVQLTGATVDYLRGIRWTNQARDEQLLKAIADYRRQVRGEYGF